MRDTQIIGPVSSNLASDIGIEFKVNGKAASLPAGPLDLAFGIEARREGLEQLNSAVLYSGDVIAGDGPTPSFTKHTRGVWSLFAEANVPLAKDLVANLALRHDRYGDFGSTSNPKLTLRWKVQRDFVLRGSVGTGFRVPALYDLFVPNTFGTTMGWDDPLRCPVTGADQDCQAGTEFHT